MLEKWRRVPHAWTKLWKHHAAQDEAERITALAIERNEPWLAGYGGRISSEWLHSKVLQIVTDAPEVYDAASLFVEAGDWIVWQMTGTLVRNAVAAGYKALWDAERGYPGDAFNAALDARLADLNATRLRGDVVPPGTIAGTLREPLASRMNLPVGIPVSAAVIDAHAAVPGCGISGPGSVAIIMGTSNCHMLVDDRRILVPGISGVARDGVLPGYYGYEAGQAGVGDMFEWFVANCTPEEYVRESRERGLSVYAVLEEHAQALQPGESGMLALDWWNGNRSVLTDAALSGMILGATIGTRAHEIYRTLIEASAFGTRVILDTFEEAGIEVKEIVACGGIADRSPLTLRIYSDVTGRPVRAAASAHASALGAAIFGTLAAGSARGGFDSLA
jgi:L-ribulokinase